MAFQSGIIEDGDTWINMMLSRNSLSHLYDEETSRKIYTDIKEKYIVLFEKLKILLSLHYNLSKIYDKFFQKSIDIHTKTGYNI